MIDIFWRHNMSAWKKKNLVIGIIFILVIVSFMTANSKVIKQKENDAYTLENNLENCNIRPLLHLQEEWERTFGRSDDDFSRCVKQTWDGGYILVGSSWAKESGYDGLVVKVDEHGNEMWHKYFGGGKYTTEDLQWIEETSDGNYIITGYNERGGGLWLIKIDAQGNMIWDKIYRGEKEGIQVCQTADGGYFVVGVIEEGDFFTGYLLKTDSNGNKEWEKTLWRNLPDIWPLSPICGQQTDDGGFIIGGTEFVNDKAYIFLIKTDEEGREIWNKTFQKGEATFGICLQQTTDGGYVISGVVANLEGTFSDALLIKTNENGDEIWSQTYEEWGDTIACYVEQAIDGEYIAVGSTDYGRTYGKVWLFKTGANGEKIWERTFSSGDEGYCVHQTTDDGYIIVGETWINNTNSDILLIKTMGPPMLEITDVRGGLGISATIKNVGTSDAENVEWSIDVEGNVFIGQGTGGVIPVIPAGGEAEIGEFVFGIGPAVVTINAEDVSTTTNCMLLGPFVIIT